MTSLCIISIFEIGNSVEYDNKKELKLCCTYVIYDYSLSVCTFVRNISFTSQVTDIFEKLLCAVMSYVV